MSSDNLQGKAQETDITLRDIFILMNRYRHALIALPIVAGIVAACVMFTLPDRYTAILKIAPSKNAPVYNWALNNEVLVEQVAKKMNLSKHYGTASRNATLRATKSHIDVVLNAKDGYLDVSATDVSPAFAARLANVFGKTLSDNVYTLRLLEISKERYNLELRRELAAKNKVNAEKSLESPQLAAVIKTISASEQYGIISLAGIQAEATLQSGISDLAQNQVVKIQDQLSNLQRLVVEGMKQKSVGSAGPWIATVTAMQESAYWSALIDRLDRRIELVKAQERDELKISWAEIPDEKSGPKRVKNILFGMVCGLLLAMLYMLVCEMVQYARKKE
ncbi:hypothetical protein [Chitinolyticbacter meiyuanensis]|uniref:hypothetical protein n=1 Tax=Chitinolyticbacter meiyuanensis TaxID=682798 RepID=UPI0011E58D16|nr:hypothetical protein [Chitinolyticbacter meiyuanensis]